MLQPIPRTMRSIQIPLLMVILLVLASVSIGSSNSGNQPLNDSIHPSSSENNSTTLGWVTTFKGPFYEYITDSEVYSDGRVVSGGWFQGYIELDENTDGVGSTADGQDQDFLLTWMDNNGTILSVVGGGSVGVDFISAVSIMPNGDVVIAGTYCLGSFD